MDYQVELVARAFFEAEHEDFSWDGEAELVRPWREIPRLPLVPLEMLPRVFFVDLLDAGAKLGAEPVDVVAVPLRRLEKGPIGHHHRPGGIIGEAHVQQLADALVRRRGVGEHDEGSRSAGADRDIGRAHIGVGMGPERDDRSGASGPAPRL